MTDIHATSLGPHPAHTLVSWPAIIAGALVAIAVGAMLNLLGVALGAASLNPFDLSRGEAEGFSALAGIWVAIANMVGLAIGGFVASRAAKYDDHHRGALLGLGVWAAAFFAAMLIAGATAAGGVTSLLSGAAERVDAADFRGAPADLFEGEADPALGDAGAALPPPIQREAEVTADATATMALWAFLTMLLGAVGAVLGARYGLSRHRWEARADLAADTGPHISTHRPTPTL